MQPPTLSGGWPIIGHLPQFIKDKAQLFNRGYDELGDIFTVKVPHTMVVLSGPERHKWFYKETDKGLNVEKAYEILKYALGEVLLTANEEQYAKQRKFLHLILNAEQNETYVKAMNIEVDAWLARLGDSGKMEIMEELQLVSQSVAGHAFAGANFREELGDAFWTAYSDIADSLNMILPPSWPLPKYKRRDKARVKVREILGRLCAQRSGKAEEYDDVISLLVNTKLKDGAFMSENEVADLWVGLMFAGHDTTARQSAWSVILSLKHPEYLARLQAEVDGLGDEITLSDLKKLPLTFQVIDEVTRLKPSADMLLRVATEDLKVGEFSIPAGSHVVVAAGCSHNMETHFKEPHLFDPDRFSRERREGQRECIMGFGGGRRKCAGIHFAKYEMVIILAKLLKNYDLTLLTPKTVVTQALAGPPRPTATYISYQRKP
ncbi:MAG: sterol 14-demethylase [Phenylobacterium sp.]|jgi:sterol 14-demethylase